MARPALLQKKYTRDEKFTPNKIQLWSIPVSLIRELLRAMAIRAIRGWYNITGADVRGRAGMINHEICVSQDATNLKDTTVTQGGYSASFWYNCSQLTNLY